MMDLIIKFKKHKQWKDVVFICKTLQKKGYKAWLAGGSVRDALLSKSLKDFDIATDATPEQIEKIFEKTVNVGKSFGVIKVVTKTGSIEVATFRKDGTYEDGRRPESVEFSRPEEDALRRDFTINALFFDISEKKVVDFVEGLKDLKKKILKTVGDADLRFSEDKLRILRAVRFVSQLGFKLDDGTYRAVERSAGQIHVVSGERLFEELNKLFSGKYFVKAMGIFEKTGLKREILPAMNFDLKLFKKTEKVRNQILLRWALVFYQIPDEQNREILWSRLKTSHEFRQSIETILSLSEKLKNFNHLSTADKRINAAQVFTPTALEFLEILGLLKISVKKYVAKNRKLPRPLVVSKDLMRKGFEPGAKFGAILKEAYARQLAGEIKTKKQGLVFLDMKARD